MVKTSRALCRSCKYSHIPSDCAAICMYYLLTKKRRGCEIGECDKYEPKTKRRVKRLSLNGHYNISHA